MLPKINIIKMPFDLLLCAAFPMSENFLHFRVSETEIRQYGKACRKISCKSRENLFI